MKRTHLFIPDPVAAELKALSKKLDVSVSELIRKAVENYLKDVNGK